MTQTMISPGGRPPHHQRFTSIRRVRMALALTLALSVGLAGQELIWAQNGTPESSPAASPTVTITPAADAPRLVLELDPLNDSGLSGTATLYEAGDKTIVDLAVKNTGNDQPAHIHAGQCGSLTAEPAFDLTPLHADGISRTVIDTPLDGLLNGQFAVDIHLSPTELGTLSACANIVGTPAVPSEATPAATPSAEATGVGGDTTPTATTTTSVSTETPVATTTAAVTTEATVTATATSSTTGSTSNSGDGTGGNSGSTSTTTGSSASSSTSGNTSGNTTTGTTSSTTSDGTGSGSSTSNGSTYLATDGTVKTADMAISGSGPLGIVPDRMDPTVFWSILSAAILLFASSVWIWFGERRTAHSHRQPPRWSRLGM